MSGRLALTPAAQERERLLQYSANIRPVYVGEETKGWDAFRHLFEVFSSKWGGDPKQVQIELIVVHNGGHVEPSTSQRIGALYRTVVGHQNADFEAAEEAWSFFKTKSAAH